MWTLVACALVVAAGLTAVRLLPHNETVVDPLDLRAVDWPNIEIPGSLCKSPKAIRLRDGLATSVPSDFDGPEPNMPQDVSAHTQDIFYGDITGDDRDEAALPVLCGNHDSTAAGQTAMGILVFDGDSQQLTVVGTLTSQKPRLGEPPNYLKVTRMRAGRITATDSFYREGDINCCPSGEATETWVYQRDRLVAR
ncbi:hypothetical protein ACH4U3_42725 [Streptomyces griseoruber]|uniref:hypothetical protein n=1 Tax=Streptomyces griseoruber TaxID=1943 RepID=UPI0037B2CB13